MVNYKKAMEAYIEKEIVVLKKLDLDELNLAMEAITDAFHRDAKIYTMGNGGSAATASHMVCDFNKGVSSVVGKKFRLQCLNDNVPSVMAIANDMSYDEVFSYQLQGVLSPIRCKTLLDGGRRRTKNLYGVFKRTVPAGQVRQ